MTTLKHFLVASDFDQTLSFNDSGQILSDLLGVPDFRAKVDGLASSNRDLEKAMTQMGVQHTFETYEGDHTNRVPERIEMNVLPFFSKNLASTAPRATAKR